MTLKPTNFRLSARRKKWVDARKNVVLKGTRLTYNYRQQERYVAKLQALVKRMTRETLRRVTALFKSPEAKTYYAMDASLSSQARILTNDLMKRFEQLFGREAKPLAEKMVKGQATTSSNNLKISLKKISDGVTLNTDILTSSLSEVVKATVTENVALIKSIAVDYQQQVQGDVMRAITTGNGLLDLIPALEKYEGVTERRAKNIALDQTRKAYNSINKGRMQKVGIEKFMWLHSGGGKEPREDHIAMDGNIYSFDDLPIIDERTGERGIPGQAINCRCTMTPVIEFDEGVEE